MLTPCVPGCQAGIALQMHTHSDTPCTVVQVNGEPQKRAEEISAEVAIALTLSQLHPESSTALISHTPTWCMRNFSVACTIANPSKHVPAADHLQYNSCKNVCAQLWGHCCHVMPALNVLLLYAGVVVPNSTQGFVQTYSCGVCRGRYAGALVKEWRAWDKRNGSENGPVNAFGDDQLFIVFVVANGGADLEHFEVHSFEEARSIILQVYLFPSCCLGLLLLMFTLFT
jgi:hypothetical protein